MSNCELCGEPMPKGEEMFKFHGYSGKCPKPPIKKIEIGFDDYWAMCSKDIEKNGLYSFDQVTEIARLAFNARSIK